MMSEQEKMLAGQLYNASDAELKALRQQARSNMQIFNQELDPKKRQELLNNWWGSTGKNSFVETNFSCDYGCHIHVGDNFFANFNCTFLDVCDIKIGHNALIGPNCQLLTPLHPLDAEDRVAGLEFGAPIAIGDNVWLGGGVTILPGVTLGNNVVVGAGSVVTKSFGDNVLLAGNPARIIRHLD